MPWVAPVTELCTTSLPGHGENGKPRTGSRLRHASSKYMRLARREEEAVSPLVRRALEAITARTNLRTGLADPNDMNAAKEMFLRVRRRRGGASGC